MNPTIIIQARLGSTRFPRKVLADLHGRPLLAHVIERARQIEGVSALVVATTDKDEDQRILVPLIRSLGAVAFSGSENDVLDRYYQCARAHGADPVIRLTSDCPLLNPAVSSAVVRAFLNDPRNYTHNIGPGTDGWDTEVLPFSMLAQSWREAKLAGEREHVTLYARTHFAPAWVRHVETERIPGNAKWSVDTEEDLERVRMATEELGGRSA